MGRQTRKTCELCDKPAVGRGWCGKHYQRWKKHGNPEFTKTPTRNMSDEEYLCFHGWNVNDGGCWEWKGQRTRQGYGLVSVRGERRPAHRVAYTVWVGPIPEGLIVRHLVCDNPPCINPDHLSTGTLSDNVQDMLGKSRNRPTRGEQSGTAKLTQSQVDEIRHRYVPRRVSQQQLADEYGVTQTTVGRILRGEAW